MQPIIWQKQGRFLPPEGAPAWRARQCGMVSVLPWENRTYRMFLTGLDEDKRYQIGWLDLERDLSIRYENPQNPVLTAGRMGSFDYSGACMPGVDRVSDSVVYMYYVGWNWKGQGIFSTDTGLAISRDNGATWQRHSEASILPRDVQDPLGTGTVFVLREAADHWGMWYTTYRNWEPLEGGGWQYYYHIKYAESEDGIIWHKPAQNVAIDFIDQEYALGRPMVVREQDGYRIWFCTRSFGSTYRIGYAESQDGLAWERKPSGIGPSHEGWDAEMVEYAYVLKEDNTYLMFYNGNGCGASGTGSALGI
jgi:hypothetical protein